jgi:transposase
MVPTKKVVVTLAAEQRRSLDRFVHPGTHPAALRRRAHILRKADAGGPDAWTDEEIAGYLATSRRTVTRVRQQSAAEGLDATPHRKNPAGRRFRKPGGGQEAQLVALACTHAPGGHARWAMGLLADEPAEWNVVEAIDPSTVWRTLKKTTSSPGSSTGGSSQRRTARRS